MKEYFGEPELIEIHGFKMYIYPRSQFISPLLKRGEYEPEVTKEFIETLKPGDRVVDVGACMGYYTLLAAKLVGKDGHVYAFEPEPNLYQLIKTNLELNQYENVTVIQRAVLEKGGKRTLSVSGINVGGHSVIERLKNEVYTVEVKAISLDEYFRLFYDPIKLIKIDAENSEFFVVKGALNTIRKNNVQKIIIEVRSGNLMFINDLLQPEGFKIYFPGDKKLQLVKIYELCKIYEHLNVVFTREEI